MKGRRKLLSTKIYQEESIKSTLSWFSQVPRLLSYIDSRGGNSSQHFDFFFFFFPLRLNGKLLYLRTSLREVR